MSLLSRLLGIWAMGKTVSATTPLFMRLLLGMAAITLSAVFIAVLLALVMASGVWLAYGQLIAHGWPILDAVLLIGAVLSIMVLLALMAIRHYWRKAYRLSKQILYLQAPISGRLNLWSDAFMRGFNAH